MRGVAVAVHLATAVAVGCDCWLCLLWMTQSVSSVNEAKSVFYWWYIQHVDSPWHCGPMWADVDRYRLCRCGPKLSLHLNSLNSLYNFWIIEFLFVNLNLWTVGVACVAVWWYCCSDCGADIPISMLCILRLYGCTVSSLALFSFSLSLQMHVDCGCKPSHGHYAIVYRCCVCCCRCLAVTVSSSKDGSVFAFTLTLSLSLSLSLSLTHLSLSNPSLSNPSLSLSLSLSLSQ